MFVESDIPVPAVKAVLETAIAAEAFTSGEILWPTDTIDTQEIPIFDVDPFI